MHGGSDRDSLGGASGGGDAGSVRGWEGGRRGTGIRESAIRYGELLVESP